MNEMYIYWLILIALVVIIWWCKSKIPQIENKENAKQKELIEKYQFERQAYISVDKTKENMFVFGRFEAIFRLRQILEENDKLNKK